MNLFKNFKSLSVIKVDELKNTIDENGPTVAVYAGTIALIAGGVLLAVKASSIKATAIKRTHKSTMDDIHGEQMLKKAEYTEEDAKKDTITAYKITAVELVKLYYAPVGLMALGTAGILFGTCKMKNKITGLTTEVAGLITVLNEYRKRVQNEVGEEKERDLYVGTTSSEKISSKLNDDTSMDGKTKKVNKAQLNKNPMVVEWGEYNWDGSKNSEFESRYPSSNYISARATQRNANSTIDACLNGETVVIKVEDILKQHGIPVSSKLIDRAWVVSRDDKGHLYCPIEGGYSYVDTGIDIDHIEFYVDADDLKEEKEGIAEASSILFVFSGTVSYSEYLKSKEKGLVSVYKPVKAHKSSKLR
jgi:hypothetical protein